MKTFNQVAIDHAIELDRLRAVNAELLTALQWARKCVETGAWKNEDGETPDIAMIDAAIARAQS